MTQAFYGLTPEADSRQPLPADWSRDMLSVIVGREVSRPPLDPKYVQMLIDRAQELSEQRWSCSDGDPFDIA